MATHSALLRQTLSGDYTGMFREPGGALKHPFLTPGTAQYADQLWDWDAWLTNVALRQIFADSGDQELGRQAEPYERGCILNFLEGVDLNGYVPITMSREPVRMPENIYAANMHKPCLAQHAAFLVRAADGDASWLREAFFPLNAFLNNYRCHHRHEATGLYYWQNDHAIGVDNDPSTYGRPPRSSASIYLNCLMVRELQAAAYLARQLALHEVATMLDRDATQLIAAIREHCWDEWTGAFYSVDLNLVPHEYRQDWGYGYHWHGGAPREWPCLIQRIAGWSGFLALWAGVATAEQAERIVAEHVRNDRTFRCPAGIRTLSPLEKMYNVRPSGNPSSWLGPVWGVSNYLTFRGLLAYGFEDDARELCDKTIALFGRDLERFGALHEYYQPDNGEPLLNRGFQNWNYLVLNMIAWREGRPVVEEFRPA